MPDSIFFDYHFLHINFILHKLMFDFINFEYRFAITLFKKFYLLYLKI